MNSLAKASIIPVALASAAVVVIQSFHQQTNSLSVILAAPAFQTYKAESEIGSQNTDWNATLISSNTEVLPIIGREDFEEKATAELQTLDRSDLLDYFLSYREYHQFDKAYSAKEYELFQWALEIEPFAALDYMVSIGHDASSEFFCQFLYSDFMVHQGKADVVIDYINLYGPTVPLMNLVTFANREEDISPMVQRDVLNEYIAGNAAYHQVIRYAGWDSLLTPDEKVKAFLATSPEFVEEPYELVNDIIKLENPTTYAQVANYIETHPDRYRIYNAVKHQKSLDLSESVARMMERFDQMSLNDQVQTALIALEFGSTNALTFLADAAEKPIILNRPINLAYIVENAVTAPDYLTVDLAWVRSNSDALVFNNFTGKYEY